MYFAGSEYLIESIFSRHWALNYQIRNKLYEKDEEYHRNGINRRIRNARRRTIAHRVGRRKPRRARHSPRDGAQEVEDIDFEHPVAENKRHDHRY